MANHTSRTEEKDQIFLDALRAGMSISAAARTAGYRRRTLYDWRRDDEAFRQEWDDAVDEGTDLLEDEVMRRARDGSDKPVFYQGEKCGVVKEYSDTLAIFMLKARRPEKFRERVDMNHGLQEDNPLTQIMREIAGNTLKPVHDPDPDDQQP